MLWLDFNDERSFAFRAWRVLRKNLNFYRIHILFFTTTPTIFAAIFYASNGEYKISFTDALFNCVSAITGTGLTTIDLSSLTVWQQVILFLLAWFGSPVTVSWVMVYTRRHYFAKKFETMLQDELLRRAAKSGLPTDRIKIVQPTWSSRSAAFFKFSWLRQKARTKKAKQTYGGEHGKERSAVEGTTSSHPQTPHKRFRADMIRRIDHEQPRLVDPSGQFSAGSPQGQGTPLDPKPRSTPSTSTPEGVDTDTTVVSPEGANSNSQRLGDSSNADSATAPFARHQTVEFAPAPITRPGVEFARYSSSMAPGDREPSHRPSFSSPNTAGMPRSTSMARAGSLPRTTSLRSASVYAPPNQRNIRDSGFGGFPTPDEVLTRLLRRFFPRFHERLKRSTTLPAAMALTPAVGGAMSRTGTVPIVGRTGTMASGSGSGTAREVPYISFDAIVGHNSEFRMMTSEQLEELGGAEYRALNTLLWVLPCYQLGVQLACFVMIAPYMAAYKWKSDFLPPNQHKPINEVWFSLFQVVSAYTNLGMSLVDQSLVPFQTAYLMLVIIPFLILAGNTALPVFLRLFIWTMKKLCRRGSRLDETLHFLLDHPRRCFVYLFPSHQTWFLVFVLVVLNGTDWLSFMVLDIGNPLIDSIPLGIRFLLGLVQSTAVRCAGFATVSLAAVSPAVKVNYALMMYVSVYPISISVRSTNVYEDRSLGIFAQEDADQFEDEEDPTKMGIRSSKRRVWGRYVGMHVRKQLAFDMWWLGLTVFLICIVERGNLNNANQATWFNIFDILFEIISAYGNVGLSLGIPTENYSFSGAFHVLSKLIVCAVMLRGRHRGLPVAIDRAVMIPSEFASASSDNKGRDDMKNERGDEGDGSGGVNGESARPDGDSGHGTARLRDESHRDDQDGESVRWRRQGGGTQSEEAV